jgi:putative glutamine amidotransferase
MVRQDDGADVRRAVIAIGWCSKLPDYEEAVRRAGGDPWVVDSAESAAEVVRRADGILLAGGGDVDPSMYGEAAHPTFGAAEPGRDVYEIELVRRALDADLPMLAICRGIQVLNVARGGSLVQDIASQLATTIEHRLAVPPHAAVELAHEIWLDKDSLLARLIGGPEVAEAVNVNSRHHQAARELGEGLVSTATAPDGVVEAIEDPSRRFCLGVQWHPENFYRTGEFRSLFEGLVRAST